MERRVESAPKFFKVILPSPTVQQKLRLPDNFAQQYENQFGDVVKLTDCAGGVWYVDLEKADDALWLRDGWDKFYRDHSVEYGYLVLFKYKGRSIFRVNVFDLNGTEVLYPPYNNHKRPRTSSTPNRGVGDDNPDTNSVPKEVEVCPLQSVAPNGRSVHEGHGDLGINIVHAEGTSKHTYPSFTVEMKDKIDPKYIVYVPAKFVRKYLGNFSEHAIELHDSDGKKWRVGVNMRDGMLRYFRWIDFSEAKGINNEDTCVFQLIHRNNPVAFKVSKLSETSSTFIPI